MPDTKLQGEQVELAFACRTASLGRIVSKPYGDSAAYDFIVDAGGCLYRVQVRSAAIEQDAGDFRIATTHGGRHKRPYTAADFDILAAYVIPHDTWYLIPVNAFAPVTAIHLCPHRPSRYKFEPFREAWHLFAPRNSTSEPERSEGGTICQPSGVSPG